MKTRAPRKVLFSIALLGLLMPGCRAPSSRLADLAIPAPNIPDRIFNITDFGAVGDGRTLNTDAIKKAIAACGKAGGGMVEVPAGRFVTGPFQLVSNLDLDLAEGATIAFSDDRKNYKLTDGGYEICLTAEACHDISITGKGTIDGQGKSWWDEFRAYTDSIKPGAIVDPAAPPLMAPPHRPYMIMITDCTRLLMKDVTLANSPMFHFVPRLCRDVRIDSITIKSPSNAPNTDGIDPSGWNYLITHCTIDTGDDNIALKPRPVPDPDHLSCENFLIEHCTFLHGHGMSIGGGSNGGVRNMTVRNCNFDGTDSGIRLKSGRDRGGLVENLTYENLTMKNVGNSILITSYYPKIPKDPAADPAQPITGKTPIWRHIRISHITSEDSASAIRIVGLAEMPVQDVEFNDIHIGARKGIDITHGVDIRMNDCQVTSQSSKTDAPKE